MTSEVIKVGVIGVGRGTSFAQSATEAVGLELVALCDRWQEKLESVGERFGVATYTDYDEFLDHDMDAVILANYFHQHAPFALKALRAGKHVMSETICNATLAEGVELCRTVEETGLTYMLAENYPYTAFNQELRRLYREGEIGEVLYAEGEYNHPHSPEGRLRLTPGTRHWRAWIPSTYYCTHALAPLVYITDTWPQTVNALSIASEALRLQSVKISDIASVFLCRMDNGAVFRILGTGLPGHSNWYRLHGHRGGMELARGGTAYFGTGQIRVWHEDWDLRGDDVRERTYAPEWPEHSELAVQAGHGGGDFWTNLHFAEAIRSGKPPFLDVYRGVTTSSVGILAWRSALQEGTAVEVPDFRSESKRAAYADDHWSPDPERAAPGQPPPSIYGFHKPSPEGLCLARKVWPQMGYHGD
ncbi:MAG: Gfo/Idh/MocA family oxidoreductase [Candidatus Latescibacterota bacterium]|nr:Gfo/Idh/MocA family oxidoreductase [Candidatus Latescibacterota bacterium]